MNADSPEPFASPREEPRLVNESVAHAQNKTGRKEDLPAGYRGYADADRGGAPKRTKGGFRSRR